MAKSPLPAAAIIPRGTALPAGGRSPSRTSVTPFQSGPRRRWDQQQKETARRSPVEPQDRAMVIVIPERETPGISARLWARPTASAVPGPRSDICLVTGVLSAIQRRRRRPPGKWRSATARQIFGDEVLADAPIAAAGRWRWRRTRRVLVARRAAPRTLVSHAGRGADVVPEVGHDGDERPDVEGDVERLVELPVRLEVLPLEEPRDED